jgi:hypothetical protein
MATIVLGIGTSHSPLLALEAERWGERAADDLRNQRLNTSDGRWISYDALNAEVGGKYASVATVEHFVTKNKACQDALDRLGDALAAARPDIVVIIGDDQSELFGPGNTPSVAVYYGAEIAMRPRVMGPGAPSWAEAVAKGYAMDRAHVFAGEPRFGAALIEGLMAQEIDLAVLSKVENPEKAGFGHAFGFVVKRLFRGARIPIVPVLLNTYYPPNVPTPARCHDIGRALRRTIEAVPQDARVAVIASGGLSHFVVDEELDYIVINALRSGRHEPLRHLPAAALNAGSSEIRNWVAAAGAVEGMANRWLEYQPLYRTPAGTGIGVAFTLWS